VFPLKGRSSEDNIHFELNLLGGISMKSFSGATSFGGLPRRWCWCPLQVAALSFLMLAYSIGISLAQVSSNPKPHDHVYLLRGFANVFSLGMDQIATKLQHQGALTPL
jgi:hypothetical protein